MSVLGSAAGEQSPKLNEQSPILSASDIQLHNNSADSVCSALDFNVIEDVHLSGPGGRIWDVSVVLPEYISCRFGPQVGVLAQGGGGRKEGVGSSEGGGVSLITGMSGLEVLELGAGTGLTMTKCSFCHLHPLYQHISRAFFPFCCLFFLPKNSWDQFGSMKVKNSMGIVNRSEKDFASMNRRSRKTLRMM